MMCLKKLSEEGREYCVEIDIFETKKLRYYLVR